MYENTWFITKFKNPATPHPAVVWKISSSLRYTHTQRREGELSSKIIPSIIFLLTKLVNLLHLFRNQWHAYSPFIFYMPYLSITYQTTSRLGVLWQQPSVHCQFCSLFCALLSSYSVSYSVSLTWSHSCSFLVTCSAEVTSLTCLEPQLGWLYRPTISLNVIFHPGFIYNMVVSGFQEGKTESCKAC